MKERLIKLIEQIGDIEKLFKRQDPNNGMIGAGNLKIYDNPDFQLWLQSVTIEIQEIADRTNDTYIKDTF